MKQATEKEELEWLQKHYESIKMKQLVDTMKTIYVPSAKEIVEIIGRRFKTVRCASRKCGFIELELKRLEAVKDVAISKLKPVSSLPSTNSMNPFHKTLIESFLGNEYNNSLLKVRKAIQNINKIWKDYSVFILAATSKPEAIKLRKEGSGRIISIIRRIARNLEIIKIAREEIIKTHIISEGLPVVVVAGIPNSGKSTLVKRISSAKPEVAPYPFTTKNIIVGKVHYGNYLFYVVDTPGVMEKPPSIHSEAERKAMVALSALPDIILYLFDLSPNSTQEIEYQISLLQDIIREFTHNRSTKVVIAANKIDETSITHYRKLLTELYPLIIQKHNKLCVDEVIPISALKGHNISILLSLITGCLYRSEKH